MAGIANARLEAPAPEIEPEDRLASHPHAGPLTQKTEACLLLARQQVDRAADHPFEPAEQLLAVGGVAQGGGGQGHHHVDLRLVGGGPQPAHGPDRRGCPVSRDTAGPGDFGSQVEKRPPTEHRCQHAVPAGIHHHQMERATPEIEHGHSHSRHRRDATRRPPRPIGETDGRAHVRSRRCRDHPQVVAGRMVRSGRSYWNRHTGSSAAWQRACFGSRRSGVQIPPSRHSSRRRQSARDPCGPTFKACREGALLIWWTPDRSEVCPASRDSPGDVVIRLPPPRSGNRVGIPARGSPKLPGVR